MNSKSQQTEAPVKVPKRGHALEATVGTLGAVSGAGLGALAAGPPGAIVGGIIGAAIGATTGWAADERTAELAEVDEELDKEIGVSGGSVGAPNLQHPPIRVGTFSGEASGASGARRDIPADADGPLGHANE